MSTLFRNVSGQKIVIFAYDANGDGISGEAANITAQISKDLGTSAALTDTNPTELDATNHPGVYYFNPSQSETDADLIVVTPSCSTSGVYIDPVIVYTQPQLFTFGKVASGTISTTTIPTDLGTLTADAYKDMWIVFTSGAAKGQAGRITTSSTSGTLTITSGDLVNTPSANDEFVIIGSVG